ncbi:HAMP domain-containing sensor histidine kinase [Nocardioides sp. WV_118_6]
MLHPYAVLLLQSPTLDPMAAAGGVCMVLAELVLLGSAQVLTFDARIDPNLMRSRLAAAAALVAVQDLPLIVWALADPSQTGQTYRLSLGQFVTLAAVLALVAHGARGTRLPRMNPMATGLLLGLLVLGVRLTLILTGFSAYLDIHRPLDMVMITATAGLIVLMFIQLVRSPLPHWAALRVGTGIVLLFVARLWASILEAPTPPPITVIALVLCNALILTTVISLLFATLTDTRDRESLLLHRAAVAEATVQHDREVVHEVRAATAGIVAGVHLLASDQVPPGPRRDALQRMVDVEAERLRRRVADEPEESVAHLSVDDLVEPLVIAQEALGHRVTWRPGGLHVVGRHDGITEVLNILLTNAHRHAHGTATTVASRVVGREVEIRVSDHGPGIDPALRYHLFQWGARGTFSTGQGIGLQRAHRLMLELGGSLRLGSGRPDRGATFVVTLPHADTDADVAAPARPLRLSTSGERTTGMAG